MKMRRKRSARRRLYTRAVWRVPVDGTRAKPAVSVYGRSRASSLVEHLYLYLHVIHHGCSPLSKSNVDRIHKERRKNYIVLRVLKNVMPTVRFVGYTQSPCILRGQRQVGRD